MSDMKEYDVIVFGAGLAGLAIETVKVFRKLVKNTCLEFLTY